MADVRRIDAQHHLSQLMQKSIERFHAQSVQVDICDQEILLSGSVNSWHQKQLAQESIRDLGEMKQIRNEIQVTNLR